MSEEDEYISRVEEYATKWYSSTNEDERQAAQRNLCSVYGVLPSGPVTEELSCEQLASVPSCIPQHEAVIRKSRNQFAVLFAAGCMIATIDRHWRSFSLESVADLRAFALSALHSRGEDLPRIALLKIAHFLCRLTKLGWRSNPLHAKTVEVMLSFLAKPGPIAEIALETLELMIAEIQERHSALEDRGIIRIILFRDTSLKRIFHAGLAMLRRLRSSGAEPAALADAVAVGATAFPEITRMSMGALPSSNPTSVDFQCLDSDLGERLTSKVVKILLACLTYDFSGMGSSMMDEEVTPIPVPSNWKALRDPRNAELFFELFHSAVKLGASGGPDSLAVLALQCVVQLASIRASLFFGPSRDQHVNNLLTHTITVMKNRDELLQDSDGIHEICRLLFRLRTHNQLSILSRCDRFDEWIQETAAFTQDCCFSWDQVSSNSLTYLLLLWCNLVSPGATLRPPLRKVLWESYEKVAKTFVTSRLLLCDAAAKAAVADAPPGALDAKGPWANPAVADLSSSRCATAAQIIADIAADEALVWAHASNMAALCKYNLPEMASFLTRCITESLDCFPTPAMTGSIPKDALERVISAAQARVALSMLFITALCKVANSSVSLGKGPYAWVTMGATAAVRNGDDSLSPGDMETDVGDASLHEGLEAIPEGGEEGDTESEPLQGGVDSSLASALDVATPKRRSASHDGAELAEGARSAPGPATGKRYKKRLTLDMWMGSPLMQRFEAMKLEGSATEAPGSRSLARRSGAGLGRSLTFDEEAMKGGGGGGKEKGAIPFGHEEEYGMSSENALLSQMNALLTLNSANKTESLMARRGSAGTASASSSSSSYANTVSSGMNVLSQSSPMITTFTTTTSTYHQGDGGGGMSMSPAAGMHASVEGPSISTQTKPWDRIIQSSSAYDTGVEPAIEIRNPLYTMAANRTSKRHACRHLIANLAEKVFYIIQLLRASGPHAPTDEAAEGPGAGSMAADVAAVGTDILDYIEDRVGSTIRKPLGVVITTSGTWSSGRELIELACFRFLQFFAAVYAAEREEASRRGRVYDLLGLSAGMVAAWNMGGTDRVKFLLSQGAQALRGVATTASAASSAAPSNVAGDATLGAVGMTLRLIGLKEPHNLLDLLLAKSVDILRLPSAPSIRIVTAALETFEAIAEALISGSSSASSLVFPLPSRSGGATGSSDLLCTTVVRMLLSLRKPLASVFPIFGDKQYLRQRTGLYATLTQLVMLHANKIALATSPLMSDIIRSANKPAKEENMMGPPSPDKDLNVEQVLSRVFAAPNDPAVTSNGFYEYGTEDSSWFRAYIAPLDAVGRSLHGGLQHSRLSDEAGTIGVRAFDFTTLVGWFRDVTGLIQGTLSAKEYNLVWDWFRTRHLWMLPDFASLFRQHFAVLVPLLRLVEELVLNSRNRIEFGPVSDAGYVLFQTAVKVLHTVATHSILSDMPTVEGRYNEPMFSRSQKLKIIRIVLCAAARLLSGPYVNFGIMELYSDEHPAMLEGVILRLALSVGESEMQRFPKIAAHLTAALERLVTRSPEHIFSLDGPQFQKLVRRLLLGARSEETISTAQASSALMCLGERIYTAVTFEKAWALSSSGRGSNVPGSESLLISSRQFDKRRRQVEVTRNCVNRLNAQVPGVWEDIVSQLIAACIHDNVQHLWGLSRALLPYVLCFPQAVSASLNTILATLGIEVASDATRPEEGSEGNSAYRRRMVYYLEGIVADAYRTPVRVLNRKGVSRNGLAELEVEESALAQQDAGVCWPEQWPAAGKAFGSLTIPRSGPPAFAVSFPCKDHFMRDMRVLRLMVKRKPTASALKSLSGRPLHPKSASWTGATSVFPPKPMPKP